MAKHAVRGFPIRERFGNLKETPRKKVFGISSSIRNIVGGLQDARNIAEEFREGKGRCNHGRDPQAAKKRGRILFGDSRRKNVIFEEPDKTETAVVGSPFSRN